jgi:hypothetical protein
VSTLMTERRRPLDNADGQESLFGGEAFALTPGAPVSWQRPAPERSADAPREDAAARAAAPLDEAQAGVFEAGARARIEEPPFEAQAEAGYESGPSAEDLAAYAALEAGTDAQLLAGPTTCASRGHPWPDRRSTT